MLHEITTIKKERVKQRLNTALSHTLWIAGTGFEKVSVYYLII
jgi:hypothetical protein